MTADGRLLHPTKAAVPKAIPSGTRPSFWISPKRSTRAGIGPFLECSSGCGHNTRKTCPNRPCGTAWISSTIHTNQQAHRPSVEAKRSRRASKRGHHPVRGAVERETLRDLLLG